MITHIDVNFTAIFQINKLILIKKKPLGTYPSVILNLSVGGRATSLTYDKLNSPLFCLQKGIKNQPSDDIP